ncbi:hypothetical protein MTR67_025759, partial [Solanum verrucosum]
KTEIQEILGHCPAKADQMPLGQQRHSGIEEEKLKRRCRDKKRSRIDAGNFSHARSDGHGRSRYRQGFSGQGSSNGPTYDEDRVSNPKPPGISSGSLLPTCARCGKRHKGRCLADTRVTSVVVKVVTK